MRVARTLLVHPPARILLLAVLASKPSGPIVGMTGDGVNDDTAR